MRDALAKLNGMGVEALGISPDSPAAQKKFSDKLKLDFSLLTDTDHAVASAYGVWGEKTLYGKKYMGITRSSFLINGEGKIAASWYKVSPDDTVPKALGVLEGG